MSKGLKNRARRSEMEALIERFHRAKSVDEAEALSLRFKKLVEPPDDPNLAEKNSSLIRLIADFLNQDLGDIDLLQLRSRLQLFMPVTDVEGVLTSYGDNRSGTRLWLRSVKGLQSELRSDLTAVLKPASVVQIVVKELKRRANQGLPLGHGLRWNCWLFAEMKNRNLSDKMPRLTAKEALQVPMGDMIVPAKKLKNVDWIRWATAWRSRHSLDEPESDKAYHLTALVGKLNRIRLRFDRSLQPWKYVRAGIDFAGSPIDLDGEKWAIVERRSGSGPRQRMYEILDMTLRDGSFTHLAICRSCDRFFTKNKKDQACCSTPCNSRFQNARRLREGYFKKQRYKNRKLEKDSNKKVYKVRKRDRAALDGAKDWYARVAGGWTPAKKDLDLQFGKDADTAQLLVERIKVHGHSYQDFIKAIKSLPRAFGKKLDKR